MNPELVTVGEPPCNASCPAGVNVQAYVGLISQGRFREALDVVRDQLPFPGICGRVCPAPCELSCSRAEHGGPLAVRALKRFVADAGREYGPPTWMVPERRFTEQVAVVGSGPAGLTAALELRRLGYPVTVFEAMDQPGGMLEACIPSFRLPRDVVREEVEAILRADIEVRTGTRVGRDISVDDLFEQGYAAILIAVGAHRPQRLGIPGDEADGVLDAIEFLSRKDTQVGRHVVVVGGGSTAMDAARTALRLGAQEVRIAYRRTQAEMPAAPEEVEHALQEGVILQTQVAPLRVGTERGQVASLQCQRTRQGDPDESGRRRPVIVPGSEFSIDTDQILLAIGQKPDPLVLLDREELMSNRGLVTVDPETLQAAQPGIFAAGDAVTGPATIVEAVGLGHQAARSIHWYLQTGRPGPAEIHPAARPLWQLDNGSVNFQPRSTLPVLPADQRRFCFDEAELSLNAESAMAEAGRCVKCGSCSFCQHCSSACDWRLVEHRPSTRLPFARVARTLFRPDVAGATLPDPVNGSDTFESLVVSVREDRCRGCGQCVEVCDFDAPMLRENGAEGFPKAWVDPDRCRGCGVCVAECPSAAIDGGPMDDTVLRERLSRIQPGVAVRFQCHWADQKHREAGREDDHDEFVVPVPCAGRVSPGLMLEALAHGATRVAVKSCGEEDCRYGGAARLRDRLGWLQELYPEQVHLTLEEPRCRV